MARISRIEKRMIEGIFSHCPLCRKNLHNKEQHTRWIHDIMNHREYWESQHRMNFEFISQSLYRIIEHYHKHDVLIE